MGGGAVVRRWWRWRVNRSASLGVGCGRLFFHPCKIDASALKGRSDRSNYSDLLIGQKLKIFRVTGWTERVPAEICA